MPCTIGRNIQKYSGSVDTGIIPVIRGGTGLTSFAEGDLLYASATNVLSALAIDADSVGNVLTITGPNTLEWQPPSAVVPGSVGTLQQVTTNGYFTTVKVSLRNEFTSLEASGNVLVSGNLTAQTFYGDGSNLTGIITNNGVIKGDIIYSDNDDSLSNLAIGTPGQVLAVDDVSGVPIWKTLSTDLNNVVENESNTGIGLPVGAVPYHSLEVGSNVVIDDTGSDVLYVRGNVYSSRNMSISDTMYTDRVVCRKLLIKNCEVVAERPTKIIRLT